MAADPDALISSGADAATRHGAGTMSRIRGQPREGSRLRGIMQDCPQLRCGDKLFSVIMSFSVHDD